MRFFAAVHPRTSSRVGNSDLSKQTLHVVELSDDIDNDSELKKLILEQLGQPDGDIIVQRGEQLQQALQVCINSQYLQIF